MLENAKDKQAAQKSLQEVVIASRINQCKGKVSQKGIKSVLSLQSGANTSLYDVIHIYETII